MNAASPSPDHDRQWWTQQWLDLINSYRFKKRLERGWRYAREGNVLSIRFKGQKVLAEVQGTEEKPYRLSLWLDPLGDEDWDFVIESLSEKAIFSAKLLAGEMPTNIEQAFAANGLRLFPFNLGEVHSRCSCPDKANPCKHISAVYYLLGDRFSEDPFVLFQLRGRTREQLLQGLRQQRQGKAVEAFPTGGGLEPSATSPGLGNFWRYEEPLESSLVVIAPSGAETVLDILAPIPLPSEPGEVGASTTAMAMTYLREVYQTVSQQAMLKAMVQAQEET
jgi:uncharacterized Zn finger protein